MGQGKAKPAFFVAVFIVVLGLLGIAAYRLLGKKADDTVTLKPDSPRPGAAKVTIAFEYSTEKKDWLEAAVAAFEKANPTIHVELTGKGSLEAAQAILDGTDHPVLWSPADSLVANLAASDYKTKTNAALYVGTAEPLVLSPLVFVVWEDRAKALGEGTNNQLSWKMIHDAVVSPKGWAGLGGKPAWGFVKLGHTDPNKSNSGLEAIVLMGFEYFGTPALTVEQLLDPGFQTFVKEIDASVQLEASTGTFMTDMIRFGPSKYDIAVVYESLAISQLPNAQGRWGSLRVYYPPVTIWSDHPIVLIDDPKQTKEQRDAATQLIAFLRSTPVQATALQFGFRPADPSVPMKTAAASPFENMAKYGLALEVPAAARPPEGPVVRNLLMMWSRVVKK